MANILKRLSILIDALFEFYGGSTERSAARMSFYKNPSREWRAWNKEAIVVIDSSQDPHLLVFTNLKFQRAVWTPGCLFICEASVPSPEGTIDRGPSPTTLYRAYRASFVRTALNILGQISQSIVHLDLG
ncbi:hypothetical protein J6590_020807 [Homalodisca vitripennis]|nr:hypothetical protein J6590_020807 [Homalodisca vitripennis]